jgi:hypothetical protein
LTNKQIYDIEQTAAPANVTIVVDNPGLQEMVDALPAKQKADVLERCSVNASSQLDWSTKIFEIGQYNTSTPLAYTWQAEFRSLHIWKQPVLAKYKYMIWMDTDAFATQGKLLIYSD